MSAKGQAVQELVDEGSDLRLNKDKLDRLLMARLMLPKEGPTRQWTVDYLMGVYSRAQQAASGLGSKTRDPGTLQEMSQICQQAQELAVSYTNLAFTQDVFHQVHDLPTSNECLPATFA